MTLETFDLAALDEHTIRMFNWQPADSKARAVIQVLHGMGEHAGRYDRFACACNAGGLAVVSHNHRGHGSLENFGHFADKDGWQKVIGDVLRVRQYIAELYPERPVVLLGHSMGSFIAQSFVMRQGGNNVALILSGSTLASRFELYASLLVAKMLAAISGKRSKNKFLNQAGLGNFNRNFNPARTDYDWLSRDETEVDLYVADPLCGGQFSNQFWADLAGGLLEICADRSISRIPNDLPLLITGGEVDPVGGQKGLSKLVEAYRRTGHDAVTLNIYPDARHEMLNETNRNEVTADIVAWIEQVLDLLGSE